MGLRTSFLGLFVGVIPLTLLLLLTLGAGDITGLATELTELGER